MLLEICGKYLNIDDSIYVIDLFDNRIDSGKEILHIFSSKKIKNFTSEDQKLFKILSHNLGG